MHLVNSLDGVEVVNARVEPNLVHDSHPRLLGLGVQLRHGRRHVARGNDMLLAADRRLDDLGVVGVGDQADGQIVLGDLGVQGLLVVDIERNGVGIGNALGEALG